MMGAAQRCAGSARTNTPGGTLLQAVPSLVLFLSGPGEGRRRLRETLTAMWPSQVLFGTERHDAGGVDVVVRDVIMALDVVEVDRIGNAVGLIEVFQVAEEVGIVDDAPDIALEVSMVHGVKSIPDR